MEPGDPSQLGARLVPRGLNVAVLAPDATQIELCLFAPEPDTAGAPSRVSREIARVALPGRADGVHHGLLTPEAFAALPGVVEAARIAAELAGAALTGVVEAAEPAELTGAAEPQELAGAAGGERRTPPTSSVLHLGPGLVYGLRAHGPWDPARGHLFNPDKLLLDPYARAIRGDVTFCDAVFAHDRRRGLTHPSPRDSAPFVPHAVLVDEAFDWQDDRPPAIPWRDTVVYEAQVRWLTARHPEVPPALRGTYLGLAHPSVIAHLLALGVTTLELLPVHASVTEERLRLLGLTNAWGYGTLGFFAPDPRFATAPDQARVEFKQMVRALHAAGIEVILDVVYNHTIEGPTEGPTLSLRGLGNAAYHRLDSADPRRNVDFTGCGNTLDCDRAPARRLVLDSLRHWVSDLHVDGFRLDLAPALFREGPDAVFAPHGAFARALQDDPVLRGVKWIAEPWDLGPRGYRLGELPAPFVQWNDRFRDVVRRFWRGDQAQLADLATSLAGSSDLFADRGPQASVNFVACHDGFTLADLVAYASKHNRANGEENRDGSGANWSSGWGAEGATHDPAILARRARVQRCLLATTVFALGVPMIGQGDEVGRTQRGNNNAYCQDDPELWVPWGPDADADLLAFASHAFALRRANAVFRRDTFFPGDGSAVRWLAPDGSALAGARWQHPPDGGHTLVMHLLAPASSADRAADALLLLHSGQASITVRLPPGSWRLRLDSARPALRDEELLAPALRLAPSCFALLERA